MNEIESKLWEARCTLSDLDHAVRVCQDLQYKKLLTQEHIKQSINLKQLEIDALRLKLATYSE